MKLPSTPVAAKLDQMLKFLLREDDSNWPKKDIVGKQELEIRIGNDHIAFEVSILTKKFVYSSTHRFYTFYA